MTRKDKGYAWLGIALGIAWLGATIVTVATIRGQVTRFNYSVQSKIVLSDPATGLEKIVPSFTDLPRECWQGRGEENWQPGRWGRIEYGMNWFDNIICKVEPNVIWTPKVDGPRHRAGHKIMFDSPPCFPSREAGGFS